MAPQPVIRVVGSLNIDFVTRTPRVPGPGETLQATSLTVHAGGKGANQAVACGKAAFISQTQQDVTVDMIGAVGKGDPYYASLLKPTLEKSGVSTTGVEEIEGVQTGTATIIVDEGSGGENRILVVPGANHEVKDLEQLLSVVTRKGDPDVMVLQGEICRLMVLALLNLFNAPERHTCIVFNPAPVFSEGIPIEALQSLGVLVVNETECLLLFKVVEELNGVEVPREEDLDKAHLDRLTKHLHDLARISIIVVTLGSRGVYYSTDISGQDGFVQNRGLVPAVKVKQVVDTTAAGDTFVGYFATALARHLAATHELAGFDVAGAVSKANKAAARCVQRNGAMESIPFGYE
ncbi:ribokinase [Capronia epimyces CBS 606.96]|uniref:Ribokinase n=1 Tax=Capronia epimyces CBS 606.96 TaxID=1182542 RepID=W9YPM7_9EURO|nr:ribokinase [Capronia epimyces CBS 606.96]EXJ91630.1 ribokinase [Capronia epimyces CBS 606.96]